MAAFLVRRAAQGVAIVFLVATLTFVLIHAAPGAPFGAVFDDPRATPELRAAWRAHYGLDQPLALQYAHFLARVVRGDLGTSFTYQRPVRDVLAAALPNTLLLMAVALMVSFAAGIGVGALQAALRGGWFDRLTSGITVVVSALPDFWVAIGAVALFTVRWPLFPAGGMVDPALHRLYSPAGQWLDIAHHLTLPALTLAAVVGAAIARYQRAALLETLPEHYVRTARAKGIRPASVVLRHALRNALIPTITLVGLAFPAIIGGAVFVETVFAWPGMGRLAVDAVLTHDYPLVLAVAMSGSAMVVLGSLLADLLYAAADPRLRHA
jgi:peptide/nickel transport system permease protein